MSSSPRATIMVRQKLIQPIAIAPAPTSVLTLPTFALSAIAAAPTAPTCCQRLATSNSTLPTNVHARAIWDTGIEGKGLTSLSDPVIWFLSSCQPGKVARRRMQIKTRTMDIRISPEKSTSSRNNAPAPIKFSGSFSGPIVCTRPLESELQSQRIPRWRTHMPKYPTRTSSCAEPFRLLSVSNMFCWTDPRFVGVEFV